MLPFSTYLNESNDDKWVTIHHQHVLIGPDGTIKAGLGGKFNGKPIQHAIDTLNSQAKEKKSTPKKASAAKKSTAEKPKTKMQHATDIIKNAPDGMLAKDIKKKIADQLGMSPAAASTYYHNIKKKLAAQQEKEQPKEEPKKESKPDIEYPEEHINDIVDVIKDNPHASPSMIIGHVKDWYKVSEKSASEMYNRAYNKLHGKSVEKAFKNVNDTIKKYYDQVIKEKGSVNGQKDTYAIFRKVKEQHPEISVEDLAGKIAKYHHEAKAHQTDKVKSYKDVTGKVESKGSKAKQAEAIYQDMIGEKPKDVKKAFVDKIGMSAATASTYYHNIKKKFGDTPAPEDTVSSKDSKNDQIKADIAKYFKEKQKGSDAGLLGFITKIKNKHNIKSSHAMDIFDKYQDDLVAAEGHKVVDKALDKFFEQPIHTKEQAIKEVAKHFVLGDHFAEKLIDKQSIKILKDMEEYHNKLESNPAITTKEFAYGMAGKYGVGFEYGWFNRRKI